MTAPQGEYERHAAETIHRWEGALFRSASLT